MLALKQNEININDVTQSYITVPSNSTPSWGSIINFDITNVGKIQECYLLFNLSGISGITPINNYPCLCSSFKWYTSISYSSQGQILDIVSSDANFISVQNNYNDQDRVFFNNASGPYNNSITRFNMGQTSTIYQTILKSYINQVQPEILNSNHNIRVSVTLDFLQNLIDTNGLPGSASVNINSISLLVKMQKLTIPTINYKLMQLTKQRFQALFTSNITQQYIALANSSYCSINLSNMINSNVEWLYFTLRPISSLTKSSGFNYVNNLLSFNIINSSNESLTNGSVLANTSIYIINKDATLGSFSTELGGSVFYWFHSTNPIMSYSTGIPTSSRLYNGSEQLQITFTSALTQNYQIDIYASAIGIISQTISNTTKL